VRARLAMAECATERRCERPKSKPPCAGWLAISTARIRHRASTDRAPTVSRGLVRAAHRRTSGLGRREYGLVHTDRATMMVFHRERPLANRPTPAATSTSCSGPRSRFALCDPRRYSSTWSTRRRGLAAVRGDGPRAARPRPHEHLHRALAGRRRAIAALLLDQRVVAGLGNIYVCEGAVPRAYRPAQGCRAVSRPALAASGGRGCSSRRWRRRLRLARPCPADGELGLRDAIRRLRREGLCARTTAASDRRRRSTWLCPVQVGRSLDDSAPRR
jgi:hypothetical protein